MASQPPFTTPYRSTAVYAYREQDGSKRHDPRGSAGPIVD
jgi:hypothetical protein